MMNVPAFQSALVLWLNDPLVPVVVNVTGPDEVPEFVAIVRVLDPELVIADGLNEAVMPDGRADTLNWIAPLNPLLADGVIVYVALLPAVTVCEGGDMVKAKSGGGITEFIFTMNASPGPTSFL